MSVGSRGAGRYFSAASRDRLEVEPAQVPRSCNPAASS